MFKQYPSKLFQKNFRKTYVEENYNSATVFLNETDFSGSLVSIKEEILGKNSAKEYSFEEYNSFILLPLYGTCIVDLQPVKINDIYTFNSNGFMVKNCSDTNCKFLLFRIDNFLKTNVLKEIEIKNTPQILFDNGNTKLSLLIMQEREEINYDLNVSKTFLGYVINGVFEVQNRLIEQQDALAFWEINTVEIESLLPNSAMVIVEF